MGKILKAVIQWTLYCFFVLLLFVGFIVPMWRIIILKEDLPELSSWLSWFSAGLSVISLLLGIFSIVFSSKDGKQVEDTLKSVSDIQQEMKVTISEIKSISQNIQVNQDEVVKNVISVALSVFRGNRADWTTDTTGNNE